MVFREELHNAAIKFDGHVTNGSLEAQVQVVRDYLEEIFKSLVSELKVAGDFDLFQEEKSLEDRPYPEYVCIEAVKRVKELYGKP